MRRLLAAGSLLALFFLYFFGLTRTGLVGPDEPRYAAIGRAMAATGDWITPRLWGSPWFEKPAFLYWMTASGFKLGLSADLAPRLPVALASVAFLIYFFFALQREFGERVAWYGTTILATSAGWLAYSHIAITDLPMSAAFAACMLVLMSKSGGAKASVIAGILLGLAILAKGLVPLVLFIPALWFLRHRIGELAIVFAAAAATALPWYLLVTLRNGSAFVNEFFWKQHFGRFVSSALQHERPIWFYIPVLLGGLFPWTPLLGLLFSRRASSVHLLQDRRVQFLFAWFAWGFVFFSLSRNKLPGYLLPLLPPVAVLLGIATAEARDRSPIVTVLLAISAILLCLVPPLQEALPRVLLAGLSHTSVHLVSLWVIPALIVGAACAWCEMAGQRSVAMTFIAFCTVGAAGSVIWSVYPTLDRQVSARGFWNERGQSLNCLPSMTRSERYGIDYYAGRDVPDCK